MRSLIICLACFLLIGCHASESHLPPVIEFTKTPKAAEGGPDKTEDIKGRVKNAVRGQKIVLYAKSAIWWVQPFIFPALIRHKEFY